MDYIFLKKVVYQIVDETIVDYSDQQVDTPFLRYRIRFRMFLPNSHSFSFYPIGFIEHCRDIWVE